MRAYTAVNNSGYIIIMSLNRNHTTYRAVPYSKKFLTRRSIPGWLCVLWGVKNSLSILRWMMLFCMRLSRVRSGIPRPPCWHPRAGIRKRYRNGCARWLLYDHEHLHAFESGEPSRTVWTADGHTEKQDGIGVRTSVRTAVKRKSFCRKSGKAKNKKRPES